MEILTDIALRAHWFRSHEKEYRVSKDTMLTPAARDFIREHGITLIYEDSASEGQTEDEVSSAPEALKAVNQLPDAATVEKKIAKAAAAAMESGKTQNATAAATAIDSQMRSAMAAESCKFRHVQQANTKTVHMQSTA